LFAFIENFSFYEKEKEVIFLREAIFAVDNFRYIKEETHTRENKIINYFNYYEITMQYVDTGIHKYDHLKYSDTEFLDVSSKNFPEYDISVISDIIKFNSFAKVIYLQNNAIGLSSSLGNNNTNNWNLATLGQSLLSNNSLIGINISQNNLGFMGAKLIYEIIINNKRIKWLNISSNQLCDEGACYIAIALEKNNSLKWLDLNNNKICYLGIEKISEALIVNKSLKKLDIGYNNFSDSGIVKFSQMIKINNFLDWLDLSGNKITIAGIKILFQSLSENKIIKYVNLWDNNVSYKEISRIDKLNLINKEIEY